MIRFRCHYCPYRLDLDDHFAGSPFTCPKCNRVSHVASLDEDEPARPPRQRHRVAAEASHVSSLDEDELAPRRRRRRPSGARTVRITAWILCFAWTLFVMTSYMAKNAAALSAVQQAAGAAMAAVEVIAGYVAARAVTSIAYDAESQD
jgi:hypothetical protein